MPNLTDHITGKCDQIDLECDRIIRSTATVDQEIGRLGISADELNNELARLAEAKANLSRQRKIISRRLFFLEIRPSAIKARIGRVFTHTNLKSRDTNRIK